MLTSYGTTTSQVRTGPVEAFYQPLLYFSCSSSCLGEEAPAACTSVRERPVRGQLRCPAWSRMHPALHPWMAVALVGAERRLVAGCTLDLPYAKASGHLLHACCLCFWISLYHMAE